MQRGAPIIVLNQNTKRESGRKVTIGNISAAKAIADVIRTSLGPRAMLKMLMDPMGGIVMTNDGNAILREITVKHPAAKSMIEISRTQDEEVGDGTTSVIVLAGEVMACAEPFLDQGMHPTVIIQAYRAALEDIIVLCKEKFSVPIDTSQDSEISKVVRSCLGTKMMSRWMDLAVDISMKAIKTVALDESGKLGDVDMKRYVRVEKVPGGAVEDTAVVMGVVLNKDVVHAKMRRRVERPRIVLLDCNLEYKKGESQTSMELSKDTDFTRVLQLEEEAIRKMCDSIIAVKPDVIFTEKGVSDLAQHFLVRGGVTALRRLKKTDNNRLARVCGARIVSDPDDLRPDDVGTAADLFEIKKIGDEYFAFVTSEKARACTILVRGPSKDVMNEMERNMRDAQCVVRNVLLEPRVAPGGGSIEMALAGALNERSKTVPGIRQWPYKAIARALEVLPRTLVQNCGGSAIRQLTALRAKHASSADCWTWGVDGTSGQLVDMNDYNIWDPLGVKLQVYKTAIETAVMLLRIDDILSGTKKADGSATESGGAAKQIKEDQEMTQMPGGGGPMLE